MSGWTNSYVGFLFLEPGPHAYVVPTSTAYLPVGVRLQFSNRVIVLNVDCLSPCVGFVPVGYRRPPNSRLHLHAGMYFRYTY